MFHDFCLVKSRFSLILSAIVDFLRMWNHGQLVTALYHWHPGSMVQGSLKPTQNPIPLHVTTVDGRNPASVDRVVYAMIYRDFCLHPRWCRISSINTMCFLGKTQILQGKTQRFYWHPRLKTLLKLGRWDHLHKVTMQFSGVQRPLFQYAVSKSFKVLPNALILRHIQSPKYRKIFCLMNQNDKRVDMSLTWFPVKTSLGQLWLRHLPLRYWMVNPKSL